MDREYMRRVLSAILIDTSEDNPMKCDIILESDAQGLSDLEKAHAIEIFQEPSEGIIWFGLEYSNELIEFDDMLDEDLKLIVDSLNCNVQDIEDGFGTIKVTWNK